MSLNLESTFAKFEDEYGKFDKVENKISNRRDLNAFLLLDKLMPSNNRIVSASEHDEFHLGIDCEKLAEIANEDDILTLVRCGVIYSNEYESLSMFA